MRVLGIAVDLPSRQRAVLRAVLLVDTLGLTDRPDAADITVVESFSIPTDEAEWVGQCRILARDIGGRIDTLEPDVVIVRRADRPARASNEEGPRLRLMATGAVLGAASNLVRETFLRNGKECGATFGGKKDDVDSAAVGLGVGKEFVEAAAAAWSGLVANRV